eukprot:TRINITY_DN16696_c0_g1_i1.p1 TRINITY_DN16696_c0_g1~~TRINITY_DN16696_c0_g1_i1.p1  ORF type:complete len:1082 (-),score=236.65 TRINITY_DN16696_c0_g1_i1:337-3582(-)
MVRSGVALCVGLLVILTLVNAWWQFSAVSARHHQLHEWEAKEAKLRAELDEQARSLKSCRLELDIAAGDADKKRTNALKDITSEREGLERGLRACRDDLATCRSAAASSAGSAAGGERRANASGGKSENLAAAATTLGAAPVILDGSTDRGGESCSWLMADTARELQILQGRAREKATDAQAMTARQTCSGRALAARAQVTIASLQAQLEDKEAQLEAALKLQVEEMQSVARDIGLNLKDRDAVHAVQKRLRSAAQASVESSKAAETSAQAAGVETSPFGDEEEEDNEEKEDKEDGDVDAGGAARVSDSSNSSRTSAAATAAAIPDTLPPRTGPCVAAVVPFRGRGVHLDLFYRHVSKFLKLPEARELCWSIYIVEQYDAALFNRGWLFNVGVAMAGLEEAKFRCIVIQDLDTLPEHGAGVNFSDCEVPTQLSSEIECYGWLPPYAENAGGVVALSPEHWYAINGFSNEYVGWGGEDDDFRLRLQAADLLRGTCGSFCNLHDRAFRHGQKGLIRRPRRGKGRFICLDEGSHTPRKHGSMGGMQSKLQAMRSGSDRWTRDGLTSLDFHLVRHDTMAFPGVSDVRLHWVKVVARDAQLRVSPSRLRLVLGPGACRPECKREGRCGASPAVVPFTVAELQSAFARSLGSCLVGGLGAISSLGFWLMDRRLFVTGLPPGADQNRRADGGDSAATVDPMAAPEAGRSSAAPGIARGAWALSEILREALHEPPDGDPALLIRAVPSTEFARVREDFRKTPARLQKPIVDVCTGTYPLEDYRLRKKQTVNVGSDDCEQRSWTHEAAFKALRSARSSKDRPVCVGEANGVWTARLSVADSCSGQAFGVNWTHKAKFYISSDATGRLMCVYHRRETDDDLRQWSRSQLFYAEGDKCHARKGWNLDFKFRSMVDTYMPPRTRLCVRRRSHTGKMRLRLASECEDGKKDAGSGDAFAVLRADAAPSLGEVFCIVSGDSGADGVAGGDCVARGKACAAASTAAAAGGNATGAAGNGTSADASAGASAVHLRFRALATASGRAWCVGRREDSNECRVEPRASCDGDGFSHAFSFREVALEDLSEELGHLTLASL